MQSEIPVVSFICAALVLVPLPCHLRARNIATVSIIAWLFVVNVIYAIDAIVWSNNSRIIAPVWCDITSTLITGVHIALPAACLCICIHLEQIASFSQVATPVAKRRRIIFESLMCFGLPLVYIALHFIVQSHRFDVFEGFGCRPTTFTSIPAIFLVWIPPLFLSLATLVHAGLSWRHFLCRGIQFARCGYGSPLSLTSSHYIRLVVISVAEVVWVLIVISVEMRFKLSSGLEPWTSLSDVHKDFSRVLTFGVQDTSRSTISSLLFSWIATPIESLLFFALFASGNDAVAGYKRCGNWIKHCFSSRQEFDSSSMESHKTPMCSTITFNE
ncbi:hypothetical protein SERLA73DRAFT_65479 [Serpula lacrymans var. lacrymans S7.3]|uniref:Fungal pheromone STE3G-protein-coupled receptor n=4 Tax=Serpula lacrymans TaxID=85982 RepID=F8QGD3_SERL3|nr:uncharacterized protein SERLADRAFT_346595 [Serpula lacrymans var. lacrymans S7.9]EGN92611.1 hypothetical protein SERLA73DRAFT_65479 [Serpula lacrymans var. lacrymans S7.3]EGO28756.1 hypothetical protein SERLADRAFT_346595 [Serpula lacrymans var. lacrymans S7.9]